MWAQRERILGLISDVCHRKRNGTSEPLLVTYPGAFQCQGRIQDCGLLKITQVRVMTHFGVFIVTSQAITSVQGHL